MSGAVSHIIVDTRGWWNKVYTSLCGQFWQGGKSHLFGPSCPACRKLYRQLQRGDRR